MNKKWKYDLKMQNKNFINGYVVTLFKLYHISTYKAMFHNH